MMARAEAVQNLYDTYAGTPWESFFLFNQIPPKKFTNAVKTYGSAVSDDEAVIFLCDDSLLSTGKSHDKRMKNKNVKKM